MTLQERLDEETKLKDSIRFLKEYCDNHDGCKDCYIKRKLELAGFLHYCPCVTLINEVKL